MEASRCFSMLLDASRCFSMLLGCCGMLHGDMSVATSAVIDHPAVVLHLCGDAHYRRRLVDAASISSTAVAAMDMGMGTRARDTGSAAKAPLWPRAR